jgi:hypothetical protein
MNDALTAHEAGDDAVEEGVFVVQLFAAAQAIESIFQRRN